MPSPSLMTCTSCDRLVQTSRVVEGLCPRCHMQVQKAKFNQLPDGTRQDDLARRVGADVLACTCGQTVPISHSVRMMVKGTGRIERVCSDCANTSDAGRACRRSAHGDVMEQRDPDWVDSDYPFLPLPDGFRPGVCRHCGEVLYWKVDRWLPMSWVIVARAWEGVPGGRT